MGIEGIRVTPDTWVRVGVCWHMVPWAHTSSHPNNILVSSAIWAQLTVATNTHTDHRTSLTTHNHTHTHTHPFNGPFSGTTQVSQYQKGKTNLDFTEARDSEWHWNQLGYMQVCTSLQTDNHANTPPLSFLPAGCPSCRPTNSVKALKANHNLYNQIKRSIQWRLYRRTGERWHHWPGGQCR